jgi:hypothetical protein
VTATATATPYTDHLWLLGFTIKSRADRLPLPITTEQGELVTNFVVTALPERGEARRLFGRKGPACSEAKSNIPLEKLLHDQEHGDTRLKELYVERCCFTLFEMLSAAAPHISKPPATARPPEVGA